MNGVYQLSTGKELVFRYDYVGCFIEGLAKVRLKGKYGFVDKTGREVIPCMYDSAGVFSDRLAKVELNGRWGVIDKTGKEVIPFKYAWAGEFKEGLAPVQLNGKCGYIDKSGKEICPFKYDYARECYGGLGVVRIGDNIGIINCYGQEVIPLIFSDIYLVDSIIVVVADSQYGIITSNREYILPCQYDKIDINDDMIIARKSNTIYEFNQFGELVKIFYD